MDACAGNVTDVCKIGQELVMSVRNFSQCTVPQKPTLFSFLKSPQCNLVIIFICIAGVMHLTITRMGDLILGVVNICELNSY